MSTTHPHSLERATYRVSEAAARAGVGERTLWRWIDSKKVPGVFRQGKIVRISKRLFDEWLENGGK
jgi:excisionase family DNA binding protein